MCWYEQTELKKMLESFTVVRGNARENLKIVMASS